MMRRCVTYFFSSSRHKQTSSPLFYYCSSYFCRKSKHDLLSNRTTPKSLFIVKSVFLFSIAQVRGQYHNAYPTSAPVSQKLRIESNKDLYKDSKQLSENKLHSNQPTSIYVNIPDYCGPYNQHAYNPYWYFGGLKPEESGARCCLSQDKIKPGLQQAFALPFYNEISEKSPFYNSLNSKYYLDYRRKC